MADFETVEQYIESQPEPARSILEQVRAAIRKGAPKAEECIAYKMPAYKIGGRAAIYFAGWKKHYSLYPATAGVVAAFERELAPYEVEKGTIRFPLSQPVPVKLIQGIAKLRAKEASAQTKP